MINSKQLLSDLQKRVRLLEDDLRARCNAQADVDAPLKQDYEMARSKGRTSLTYNAWRDEELTQVAVAWVLAGVFIRFLEDNGLIEVPWVAGAEPARMKRAQDEHDMFFRQRPTASEREYFELCFAEIAKLPGMTDFFDRRHNPLWRVGPTADAAKALLEFWRKTDPDTGRIIHDFTDPDWNTRFLGDLYQSLSEAAQKKFALLQTPNFVEEFILDRTLTPAIQTFGYKEVRMIDPTCGSGHFLLGGFERLFRLWQEDNPGENPRVVAQRALDGVYGVDLNPYAVAIARFRLLLAALRVCGIGKLKDAPDFKIHLAVGDSLLHGPEPGTIMDRNALKLRIEATVGAYQSEDADVLAEILSQHYHAVVGNPPYITVKDKKLNEAYREMFGSCHRKYSLAAPFMERFFDMAVHGKPPQAITGVQELALGFAATELQSGPTPAGLVGMITANSFMKREFGRKLVEEFIPHWDITHIIDTSGAYIPGHGTPTVILFGKNQPPVSRTIRTVMSIKAEPGIPDNPARASAWSAIVAQVDQPNSQSEFVSVAETERGAFRKHPWSIGGGGAAELKESLDEAADSKLVSLVEVIGVYGMTNADDVMLAPACAIYRRRVEPQMVRRIVAGDEVRDWIISEEGSEAVLFPYLAGELVSPSDFRGLSGWMWPARTVLGARATFDKGTYFEAGRPWWEWHQVALGRLTSADLLTFANIATHNHFSQAEKRFAYNVTAQIITFGERPSVPASDICGLLNSSVAGFWLRQVCFPKGGSGIGRGIQNEAWEGRFAFDGTKLKQFPVPVVQPATLAREMARLAQYLKAHTPKSLLANVRSPDLKADAEDSRQRWIEILHRMIALQEELDWECYRLYGLIGGQKPEDSGQRAVGGGQKPEDSDQKSEYEGNWQNGEVPPLKLGERAFEIVMARKMASGELQTTWFERHGSTPITELPAHWPKAYRELVERRIALIESDRDIGLIEQPEYKRRWNVEPWDEQLERAAREWLLIRLEGYFFEGERMLLERRTANEEGRTVEDSAGPDPLANVRSNWVAGQQPALVSTSQLAAMVEGDHAFLQVAEIYSGGPGFSVSKLVRELVESESVPFLPFQRYKDSGLRKRQDWEHVWDLQRREDAVEAEVRNELAPASARGDGSGAAGRSEVSEEEMQRRIREKQKEVVGEIPVPPKYASADFKSSTFWRMRGKLDVPKERWVLYPGAEREGDTSPVIAWAGWDHLQQAKALAEYYVDASQNRGWPPEKLQPLLAGLLELLPWVKQWHNDFNPEAGMGFGDYLASFLDEEARKQGTTVEALKQIRFGEERTPFGRPNEETGSQKKPVRRTVRSEKPVSSPTVVPFAHAYPSTPADKLVCSLALDLIAWRDPIGINDHLDALILAIHADIRRVFANTTNPSALDTWARKAKAEISVAASGGLKWVQCLRYLEKHLKALEINRNQSAASIRPGVAFENARKEFAVSDIGVAPSILAVLDEMKAVRNRHDLSGEQSSALQTLQEVHTRNALAMEEA